MDADADKPHEPQQAEPAVPVVATSAERNAQELLHELQVHQIELELQNETLRTAQRALEDSRDRYLNLYEFAPVGYFTLTAEGMISGINLTGSKLLAAQRRQSMQKRFAALVMPDDLASWYEFFLRVKKSADQESVELALQRADGQVLHALLKGALQADVADEVTVLIAVTDISQSKHDQAQLEHIAHFDALTNLPNRVLLADRLHQAMVQSVRREERVAVAYLDLDGFKAINDLHGHHIGDQLLIMVATRMKESLREGDTLGRIGGDEFVVILLNMADIDASASMLNRLLKAASLPVQIGELHLKVSASIGVTFYPQSDIDADQLLRQADQAMYQAKLAGKNRYYVFDAEQDLALRGHHESLERVRQALFNNEFVLYYQPKVNMRSGTVMGVEALIRWQCPERGLLASAEFLPVIEEHPLAIDVGEWVIHSALRQLQTWRAAGLDLPISINIGARQLQQHNFIERLREIIAQYPAVQCADLELEVLETSALQDLEQVSQVIETCLEMGIHFSLDDFGTGYSSLTYLKRLPVAVLKIDQTFVRDMLDDPNDLSILDGILGLAQAFDRQAIAEGVETLAHGTMLLKMGCELGQGFGIARPMPAASIPEWLATWRVDAAWCNLPQVSRAVLPRLYTYVEHRAWIKALASHLKGVRQTPPPLDKYQSHFRKWRQAAGLDQHSPQALLPIEQLQRQMRELAQQLVDLQCSGQGARALERLDELYGLNELLREQLKLLDVVR
jgi:diguanylate cyclase (GGDEF)-like protein